MIGNLWADVVDECLLVSFRHANIFLFDSLSQFVLVEELESFERDVCEFSDLLFILLLSLFYFFGDLLSLVFPLAFTFVQVAGLKEFRAELLSQNDKFVRFARPG